MEVGSVAGDWKCDQIIGRGNFGIVTLWINKRTQQKRAIKTFQVSEKWSEETVREVEVRWRNEVDLMLNQVESLYIVSTLPTPTELGSIPGKLLLSMEYCSGRDLRQILRQPQHASGLPEQEVRKILSAIGGAISYLHTINIIHRDLKPENILRTSPLVDGVYKLGDLGFAKGLLQKDSLSSTVVGTVQYLAPEIYLGKPYDITVDYWSFGIIAFEVCCGMRPFLHGQPASTWIPCVQAKGDEVIAIHEAADGRKIQSNKFPYNTHLSERLKQCLEMWLKMMLQTDPNKRGRRIGQSSKIGEETIGLGVLRTILQMDMLHIFCPSKRLSFAIGNSTTMADVSGWIERDIGVPREDQLFLHSDGMMVFPSDAPLPILRDLPDVEWFMIPKDYGVDVNAVVPTPKSVADLSPNIQIGKKCSSLERTVWASLIHYMRKTLLELTMMSRAISALRTHNEKFLYPRVHDKQEQVDFEMERMQGVLFMEEELRHVEEDFKKYDKNKSRDLNTTKSMEEWRQALGSIRKSFEDEKEALSNLMAKTNQEKFLGIFEDRKCLERINDQILELYDCWRQGDESLDPNVTNFYIDKYLGIHKLHFPLCVRTLRSEVEKYLLLEKAASSSSFRSTYEALESWKREFIEARLEKQRYLLTSGVLRAHGMSQSIPGAAAEGNENADEKLSELMTESMKIESEAREVLKRSIEGAEEVRGSRQKLDWSFLDSLENN